MNIEKVDSYDTHNGRTELFFLWPNLKENGMYVHFYSGESIHHDVFVNFQQNDLSFVLDWHKEGLMLFELRKTMFHQ